MSQLVLYLIENVQQVEKYSGVSRKHIASCNGASPTAAAHPSITGVHLFLFALSRLVRCAMTFAIHLGQHIGTEGRALILLRDRPGHASLPFPSLPLLNLLYIQGCGDQSCQSSQARSQQ
jgi:hypothetical protein